MWKQTKESSDGILPEPGQIVSLDYTATVLSTGQTISGNRWFTGSRSISFVLGAPQVVDNRDFVWGTPSRSNELVPLFQEAVDGMRAGEQRGLSIPPTSAFAKLSDETVQLELELV